MTDAEILAAAAQHARAASIPLDEWILRVKQPGYRWRGSEWGKALIALEQLRRLPDVPQTPAGLSLQRTIFWANVTDDAVQHACRLGKSWRHALTADPAYTPTLSQVNALKAASGGVDAWGNQEQILVNTIKAFHQQWGLNRIIHQAETEAEFESAGDNDRVIGNPNAWTQAQREAAKRDIANNTLAVTAECYNGQPDTYSSQGVPISSLTLGVAMDAGLRYPLPELLAKTPAAFKNTICCWHGSGLMPEDWDALMAL